MAGSWITRPAAVEWRARERGDAEQPGLLLLADGLEHHVAGHGPLAAGDEFDAAVADDRAGQPQAGDMALLAEHLDWHGVEEEVGPVGLGQLILEADRPTSRPRRGGR